MKIKLKQVFCIIILIGFIFIATAEPYTSYKTADEVGIELIELMQVELIYEKSDNDFKDEFLFDANQFDSCIYYACDEIMSVQELLIVKISNDVTTEELVQQIESRLESKIALFEDYANTQADLLKNAIVQTYGDFVFYAVGSNAKDCYDEFKILV